MYFSQKIEVPAIVGREVTISRYVITSLGGYFPVIAKHPDGTLAVVARDGDVHVGQMGRLGLTTSKDDGKSWSRLETVADHGVDMRNPAFGITSQGVWILGYMEMDCYENGFWTPEKPGRERRIFVRRSTDGKTWNEPMRIDVGEHPIVCPYGKIVEAADGTLFMSMYGGDRAFVIRSRDGGATWGEISQIAEGYNETALLALPSGKLLAALRTSRSNNWTAGVHLSVSFDQGKTWSQPVKVTEDYQHPADLLLLESGNILLTFGNRRPPYGVRGMISRDEGATWDTDTTITLVSDCSSPDVGYPSSVQLPGGDIFTAYYALDSGLIKQGRNHPIGVHAAGVRYSESLFDG